MAKYTKEQLIFYLKKLAAALKKTPTIRDISKKPGYPSSGTYMKRFGSWNDSLKLAGLKINARKKYDKKELLENIRLLAKELGRMPKPKDIKGKEWAASYATYRKYFGSWKESIKQAGITKAGSIASLRDFVRREHK